MSYLVQNVGNAEGIQVMMREAGDIVYNMMACEKPIISAINGAAVGAGLAVALMADISIIYENAKITDGHSKIGVAAGDHAAIVWPLLCGMAKAKYYLLTAQPLDGKEAERIGLVSLCVPTSEETVTKGMEIARSLAQGPPNALRFTKRALNLWLPRSIFDASLAFEMLNFHSADAAEGVAATKEKRPPKFSSKL